MKTVKTYICENCKKEFTNKILCEEHENSCFTHITSKGLVITIRCDETTCKGCRFLKQCKYFMYTNNYSCILFPLITIGKDKLRPGKCLRVFKK